MVNCNLTGIIILDKPNVSFYILYGLLAGCSVGFNGFIFYLYSKYDVKVLGKRTTFNFIMKLINVSDLTMSFVLIINIFITKYYQDSSNPYLTIFYSCRNLLIGFEIIVLALLAIDRFIATSFPTSTKWRNRKIQIILICYFAACGGANIVTNTLLNMNIPCKAKTRLQIGYDLVYVMCCIVLLLMNLCTYLGLFILFYYRMRRLTKEQENKNEIKVLIKIIKFDSFLLFVTLAYMINLIPVFLSNSGIVQSMPHEIYFIFYANVFIDPIIFACGNEFISSLISGKLAKSKTFPSTKSRIGLKTTISIS